MSVIYSSSYIPFVIILLSIILWCHYKYYIFAIRLWAKQNMLHNLTLYTATVIETENFWLMDFYNIIYIKISPELSGWRLLIIWNYFIHFDGPHRTIAIIIYYYYVNINHRWSTINLILSTAVPVSLTSSISIQNISYLLGDKNLLFIYLRTCKKVYLYIMYIKYYHVYYIKILYRLFYYSVNVWKIHYIVIQL